MSDIAGQDIQTHNNNPEEIVTVIRNWLRTTSKRQSIPSGSIIFERYQQFIRDLPAVANNRQLKVDDLIFSDYTFILAKWLDRTKDFTGTG